jgi:O-antigen ligase
MEPRLSVLRPSYPPRPKRLQRWSLADIAIFITPLLAIATVATPLEMLCWGMIPVLLLVGRPILGPRRLPVLTLSDYLILALIVAAAVSYLRSPFPQTALMASLYFAVYYGLIFALGLAVTSWRKLGILLVGTALAFMAVLVRSVLEPVSAQANAGLTGVLGQENATGSMAATAIVLMLTLQRMYQLGYATAANNQVMRLGLIIVPILAGGVLLLSASRGASLALAIFLALWIVPASRHIKVPVRVLIMIVAATFALLSWSRISELFVFRRFHYLAYEMKLVAMPPQGRFYDALDVRSNLMDRAVEIFVAHPLTGSGLGTFREFSSFVYTHTTFFEILYSLGLVGIVPTLLLLGLVIWRLGLTVLRGRPDGRLAWVVLSAVSYLVIQGMTLPLVTSRMHLVLLVVPIACARLLTLQRTTRQVPFAPLGGVCVAVR